MNSHEYIDTRDYIQEMDDKVNRLYQLSQLVKEMGKLKQDVEPYNSWSQCLEEFLHEWEHLRVISDIPSQGRFYDQVDPFELLDKLFKQMSSKVSWVLYGGLLPLELQVNQKSFHAFFRQLLKENPTHHEVLKITSSSDGEQDQIHFSCMSFQYWQRNYILNQIFEFTPTLWAEAFPKTLSWQSKCISKNQKSSNSNVRSILIRGEDLNLNTIIARELNQAGLIIFVNYREPNKPSPPTGEHIDLILNLSGDDLLDSVFPLAKQLTPTTQHISNPQLLSQWVIMEVSK